MEALSKQVRSVNMLTKVPAEVVKKQVEAVNEKVAAVVGAHTSKAGVQGRHVAVSLDFKGAKTNHWVQFDIEHTKPAGSDELLRIGGFFGLPGIYAEFGIPSGAADSGDVQDQLGVGCQKVQGFSRLSAYKPMILNEIRVVSEDAIQLNQPITYNEVTFDAVKDVDKINVLATQQKSDERENLLVARGEWIIDPQKFIEFTVKKGKSMQILLRIDSIANVANFAPLM